MVLKIQSLTKFVVLTVAIASGMAGSPAPAADTESSAEKQVKLIAVLQSNALPEEKAITCKKLAIYGTKDAVPALAPLLSDQELASWARIALEAIPDPAADAALRAAMGKVQGLLLVGVINSIGVRRDVQAIGGLAARLKDADAEVASAAAAALGSIGGEQAVKALVPLLATAPKGVISEVAGSCVRCAERYLTEGKTADAVKLYDTVRKAKVPKQRIREATRGAILARGTAGLPLLLEQLRSADKAMFTIGLSTAREVPGREATEAVAAEVGRASADRQTLLLMVLADRADASVLPTISKAVQSGSPPVRLAAIAALERMATLPCVPVLLAAATDGDRELANAAKAALGRMPNKDLNADLVGRMPAATGKLRRVLIEVAGLRRIADALPIALRYAGDADAGVRSAAIGTIGLLGDEKQAAELVNLLPKTQTPREREDIEKALAGISGRRGANSLPSVLPLVQSGDKELRMVGLRVLTSVGGATALAAVKSAMEDQDEAVQNEAVRSLSSWPGNWPEDAGVAEPLLTLARSGKKTAHQVLGLRGYLEYVQVDKRLQNNEKVAKVKDLLPLIKRPEDKRLAISALETAPTVDSLQMLLTFAGDPAVAEEAYLAVVGVTAKGGPKGATKEARRSALQMVAEKSKNEPTKKKAEDALKKIR